MTRTPLLRCHKEFFVRTRKVNCRFTGTGRQELQEMLPCLLQHTPSFLHSLRNMDISENMRKGRPLMESDFSFISTMSNTPKSDVAVELLVLISFDYARLYLLTRRKHHHCDIRLRIGANIITAMTFLYAILFIMLVSDLAMYLILFGIGTRLMEKLVSVTQLLY